MLKAPFPYFGGKSKIAHVVWEALGQPKHYIEPFFGSGAVLLARPGYNPAEHIETVNDKDGFVANVWRSIRNDPDEVAKYCDWPVNHADLSARKAELIRNEDRLLENLIADPEWYDARQAGYWIWAASCWIGSGLTDTKAMPGVTNHDYKGIHRRTISINGGAKNHTTIGQKPDITGQRGIVWNSAYHQIRDGNPRQPREREREREYEKPCQCQVPQISGGKGGIFSGAISDWLGALSDRLRRVRVVCGDWTQVCGGNWQDSMGNVGMFFDPPYGVDDRDTKVYHHDSTDVAKKVNEWVKERGRKLTYRIVLAGYFEEHENLLNEGWMHQKWTANGGYGNRAGNKNREREALFFSPGCLTGQGRLF